MPADPPAQLPADDRVTTLVHDTTSPTAPDRPDARCHACGAAFSPRDAHTRAAIVTRAPQDWASKRHSRVRFCDGECFSRWLRRSSR